MFVRRGFLFDKGKPESNLVHFTNIKTRASAKSVDWIKSTNEAELPGFQAPGSGMARTHFYFNLLNFQIEHLSNSN